jgi:hypothetical protein
MSARPWVWAIFADVQFGGTAAPTSPEHLVHFLDSTLATQLYARLSRAVSDVSNDVSNVRQPGARDVLGVMNYENPPFGGLFPYCSYVPSVQRLEEWSRLGTDTSIHKVAECAHGPPVPDLAESDASGRRERLDSARWRVCWGSSRSPRSVISTEGRTVRRLPY